MRPQSNTTSWSFRLLLVVSAILLWVVSACTRPIANPPTAQATLTPPSSALQLFETPRDGPAPVLNAIQGAHHSVDVQVYELTDSGVIQALIADQRAGKSVRVILNQDFPQGGNNNDPTFHTLSDAGIAVKWSSSSFRYTHEKSIIVDPVDADQAVLIMTLNLSPGYLGELDPQGMSLNFGVVDTLPSDIAQVEKIFNADWNGQAYVPPADTPLVISPSNSRHELLEQINGAKHSIHIFAQEFTDKDIVNAVVAAARRGVEVKGLLANNISGNPASAGRVRAAGGEIRYLIEPYEHAKATITDASEAYIGSINYTETSLNSNRELGILTRQPDIAAQMETEFARFWNRGVEKP